MNIIILVIGCFSVSQLSAQSGAPHPKFESFKGETYKMRVTEIIGKGGKKRKGLQERYGEFVYDYPKLGAIEIPELNIPETYISDGKFPGIDHNIQYAMVLHSKMTTSVNACYEFSLHSDDGSILWIDGEEIINNDGGHEMTLKKDSLVYKPGTYDVKVWYFQGLADRFGIVLDAKIIGKPSACPNNETTLPPVVLKLEENVFFDSGSYALKESAKSELEKIATSITDKKPKQVKVIGHTDTVGDEASNLILSQNRAEVITVAIQALINIADINFVSEGKGETQPIADNISKEGEQRTEEWRSFWNSFFMV